MQKRTYAIIYSILLMALVGICFLRFNRDMWWAEPGASQSLGDAEFYLEFMDFFKGRLEKSDLLEPFSFRPLLPLLAAQLPFDNMTSINVLNLLLMIGTFLFLSLIFKQLSITPHLQLIGLGLFTISFPVYYYATIGYVDTIVVFSSAVIYYLLVSGKTIWIPLVFAISLFGKETIVVVIAVVFAEQLVQKKVRAAFIFLLINSMIFIAVNLAIRGYFSSHFFWAISLKEFFHNCLRIHAWVSLVLSFGIPGFLGLYIAVKITLKRDYSQLKKIFPALIGIFGNWTIVFYSMAVAWTDGRFIWPTVIYSIPLTMSYFNTSPKDFVDTF